MAVPFLHQLFLQKVQTQSVLKHFYIYKLFNNFLFHFWAPKNVLFSLFLHIVHIIVINVLNNYCVE